MGSDDAPTGPDGPGAAPEPDQDADAGLDGGDSVAERVPPSLVLKWAAAGTLGVLMVLVAAYGIYAVRGILVLVFLALFLAISLDPAARWLIRHGLRRSFAITIVLSFLVVLFAGFLWSIVPPLVDQGGQLVADLPGYLRKLATQSTAVRDVTDRYHLTDRLTSLLAALPASLAGGAVGLVQQFLGMIASAVTVLVLTIYFMADLPRLQRGVVRLFPPRRRPRATQIVNVVVDKVGGYMIGNIIISLIAGAATFACLEILRVPFALPLAVTVAVTDLIPMVGATIGAAICVLISIFTVDLWPTGVVVLIFFIVYQQIENSLIAPRILRNTVDLSSVAVLLAALLGGAVLGLVGAVVAIPIAATVKVIITPAIAALHQTQPSTGPPP